MEKGNRYFLVAFQHGKGVGNIALSTEKGMYLNYESVRSVILKAFTGINSSITIINIIEMPIEDFTEWIRKNKIVVPAKPAIKLVH